MLSQHQPNLPDSLTDNSNQRLANFLSLATLKNQIPSQLFDQLNEQINQDSQLPKRLGWNGQTLPCSFSEYNLISGQQDSAQLSFLLKNQDELSSKIQQFQPKKKTQPMQPNPIAEAITRHQFQKQFITSPYKSKNNALQEIMLNQDKDQYHRMKTVFGHAIIQEGSGTAVYNCKFDRSGKFIITGGDDGIIKIWNKDNLVLQASLHGHQEVIIDIAISKCNRYMASGSKDGTLIIWDFENCMIIKKITEDHTSQINRLRFEMIECNTKQNFKNMKKDQINGKDSQSQITNLGSVAGHSSNVPVTYDQFLCSCSDDGSIIVYDVSSFVKTGCDEFYLKDDQENIFAVNHRNITEKTEDGLLNDLTNEMTIGETDDKITRTTRKRKIGQNGGITNQTTANSSSQSQQVDTDIFRIKLRSDDFRVGSRNKHIDSFSVSQKGFIAGGTNHGEIFLWKINFSNIRQRKLDQCQNWVNSFKVHKKANHYLDFNKKGDILFTGSADGTAALWDTSFMVKSKNMIEMEDEDRKQNKWTENDMPLKDINISEDSNLIYKFEEKSNKYQFECQIDSIDWSCNSRYAICAMSVKKINEDDVQETKENKKSAKCRIKVYDTYSGQVINNLDKECGLGRNMTNFVSIIKPHPFDDNILLICFDGGVNLLYNIRQRQITQEIVEYGIYSIDQYTMNNQMDVDFSQDGDYIAFSSVFGTLSLYSVYQHKKAQYMCTRVQQFFPYDNEQHDNNVFEQLSFHPQLCGYELNPYEVQPTPPIIGKFKNVTEQLTPEEFKRQQIFAREFAHEEERFYQDQLRDGMRQGYFETSVDVNDDELALDGQRLFSFDNQDEDQPMNAVDQMNEEMHYGSDMELVGGTRAMRQRRSTRLGNAQRRLVRGDDVLEGVDDDSADDDEFNSNESHEEQKGEDESSEDDMISVQEDVDFLQRQRQQRRGYQNFRSTRRVQIDESNVNTQESRRRPVRNGREGQRNRIYSNSTNQSVDVIARTRSGRNTRQRIPPGFQTNQDSPVERNRQLRRGGRNRREAIDLLSSQERSADDATSEEEARRGNRRRSSRGASRTFPDFEEPEQIQTRTRPNGRNRPQEDEFMMGADFLSVGSSNESENRADDDILEQKITTCEIQCQYERDDCFSQRGSKSKKGSVIHKEGRMAKLNKDLDDIYTIDKSIDQLSGDHNCAFCNRKIEIIQLVGPFVKDQKKEIDSSQVSMTISEPLYFHEDCLNYNQFVNYCDDTQRWLNIHTALKNLVWKKQYSCYRCVTKGATIQCNNCDRSFHGFICQKLYMMPGEDISDYMCIFCRSEDNYKMDTSIVKKFMRNEMSEIRKNIDRDHLLTVKPYVPGQFYLPQIGDEVIYFSQGHETFYQSNNCFFYSGMQKKLSSADLPWMYYKHFKNGMIRCEVLGVQQRFSPGKAEYLINKFGDDSFEGVNQVSEIVIFIELRIIDESLSHLEEDEKEFYVQIFKSKVQEFLVPSFVFDQKLVMFHKRINDDNFINKRFKTVCGGRERLIVDVSPLEESNQQCHWMSVVTVDAPTINQRMNRSRGSPQQMDQTDSERINFWQIIFPEEVFQDELKIKVPCAFEQNETERIKDAFELHLNRKSDMCLDYLERVQESIAPDYKSFIPSEMWLQLIFARIEQKYYRSQDQLFNDLEMISYCAMTYNGDESDMSVKSQNLVEKLRKEIKNQINQNKEKVMIKQKATIIVNKDASAAMNFGLQSSSNPVTPRLTPVKSFEANIGGGGSAIKNALNKVIDEEYSEEGQQAVLIKLPDGSDVIEIDFKCPPAEEKIKGRRSTRNKYIGSDENIISLITPEQQPNINSANSNDIELPSRGGRLKKSTGDKILGKRKNEMLQDSEEDFLSNEENQSKNRAPSMIVTIPLDENDQKKQLENVENKYNTRNKRQKID